MRNEVNASRPYPEWADELFGRIPANKFVPPGAASGGGRHWLDRPRVNELFDRALGRSALVLVTARPGQGKSVAAEQFLAIHSERPGWYRLGPEDRDAAVLLQSLLLLFQDLHPELALTAAFPAVAQGRAPVETVFRWGNALLHHLREGVRGELCLAIDDIHRLDPESQGGRLLTHLLVTAPPQLRCLLLGRHAPCGLAEALTDTPHARLDDADLALTAEEARELIGLRCGVQPTNPAPEQAHGLTRGWLYGVDAYAEMLQRRGSSGFWLVDDRGLSPETLVPRLQEYFRRQVMGQLTGAEQALLAQLGLLDSLNTSLLARLPASREALALVEQLTARSLFVEPCPDDPQRLRFEPLFSRFLELERTAVISASEQRALLLQAAEAEAEIGHPEQALEYRLTAGDVDAAERLLETLGVGLLEQGRCEALHHLLDRLPINRVSQNPWLLLYQGSTLLELEPAHAQLPLDRARAGFADRGDGPGELLAVAQLMSYHSAISGAHDQLPALKARAGELRSHIEELPGALIRGLAHVGLAAGEISARGSTGPAYFHREAALRLSQEIGSADLEAKVRLIAGFRHLFHGDFSAAVQELERLNALLHGELLKPFQQQLIRAMQCCYLSMTRRGANFHRYRQQVEGLSRSARSVKEAGVAFMYRWIAEDAIASGRYEEAARYVENGLALAYATFNHNLRTQYLQFRAFLYAIQGECKRARRAAAETLRLFRDLNAGRWRADTALLLGATYTRLGDFGTATELLARARDEAEATDSRFLLAGALAHSVDLSLARGEDGAARDFAVRLMDLVADQAYGSYFLMEPGNAARVLRFCARCGIEPGHVERLSRRLLGCSFAADGESIPLLRVESLGQFLLRYENEVVSADSLPRRERTYVATLVAVPGNQIDRERLLEAVWPGGEHTSANIYVVRNRLKKSLRRAGFTMDVDTHLPLAASVASLRHAWVDAVDYAERVAAGIEHWLRGEHWQADCALYEAHQLWRGPFAPTAQETDPVRDMRLDLLRLQEQKALVWSRLLAAHGESEQAQRVLVAFLRDDPINDEAVKQLFTLYNQGGSTSAAERVLLGYRQALAAEGFTPQEIDRIVHAVRAER